jgi:cytochrome c-type biogenesis protein CcmH
MTVRTRWVLALVTCAVLGAGAVALLAGDASPPATDLDTRMLEVERQLLCPQCTNKRLDVCDQAICQDMRREIRTRLERGENEQQIVDFFAGRFGDRVRAAVPKSGFNLWLWGWVLASLGLAGAAVWTWLARSRASIEAVEPLDAADEGWLDAQLREEPQPGAEQGAR